MMLYDRRLLCCVVFICLHHKDRFYALTHAQPLGEEEEEEGRTLCEERRLSRVLSVSRGVILYNVLAWPFLPLDTLAGGHRRGFSAHRTPDPSLTE